MIGLQAVAKAYGWYFFFMQLAEDDLSKFKEYIYYPMEELLYFFSYKVAIKESTNVKQL